MFLLKKLNYIVPTLILASQLSISSVSFASDITINLGYASAQNSSYAVLADKFEELAELYSDGSIDVKIRCCAQLMGEDEAFKAMQLGTIDMHIITGNNISPHFPLMDAFVLPYIFQDKKHAYQVLEGDVGKEFSRRLKEATSVELLTFGFIGDRDFYNSRNPITSMADMKGLKVRVPKNQVMIDTFHEFGASPIPLPWADTPTALQTGTVEGSDNGTSFIKSQKFYEIMPYFTALEHFSYFSPLFASKRIMGKLDDKQRDAVRRAAHDAGIYQKQEMTSRIDGIREFLTTTGGMKTTAFDRTDFIAAGQRVQNNYSQKQGADFSDFVQLIHDAAKP
jgi:tripartite ATP-independent transporter DctP family solute receptor